jgi:hypothetical protein
MQIRGKSADHKKILSSIWLQVLNKPKTCSSNSGSAEKFNMTILPCLFSLQSARVTKFTDFTNHGSQKLAKMQISDIKGNFSSSYLNYQ